MKEFQDFRSFARHLTRVAAVGNEVTTHLAKAAGKVIQKDAKALMGAYQDGVAEWPAWANLAQATIDDRLRKGFTPDDPLVRTGELRDSIEVSVAGDTAVVGTADMVMLWQENGTQPGTWGKNQTSGIPPRPVLGPAAYKSREKVGAAIGFGLLAWLAGLEWRKLPLTLLAETGSKEE